MGVKTVLWISIVLLGMGLFREARAEEQPPPQVVVVGTAGHPRVDVDAFGVLR